MLQPVFSLFLLFSAPLWGAEQPNFDVYTQEIPQTTSIPFSHTESLCKGKPCECPGENVSYFNWKRYKSKFGAEKIFIRFPHHPAVSHSDCLLTAFASENSVIYSLSGYFPPLPHIDVHFLFDEILLLSSQYPFHLLSSVVFQDYSGDWILDYITHDTIQDTLIKSRTIVTSFNSYTIQCAKPYGVKDSYDYFLESFWIKLRD